MNDQNQNNNDNNSNKNIAVYNDNSNNNKNNNGGDKPIIGENNGNVVKYNADNNTVRKINLPNKLTIFRIILVPVIMIFVLIPENDIFPPTWCKIFAAALFLIASLTDLIDGLIARKMHLMTDFGALMDPLADKFLVIGAMFAITAANSYEGIKWLTVWVTTIIFFRELAVTSVRLVAKSSDGNVIAANFAGKFKTFSQCVCVMTILLEDMVITSNINTPDYLFSYITMAIMLVLTVYSGFVYFKTYWKYIDPAK
ncbi:MAG: CDP-diacylglycerol--glycerol-3-phosphate 3-phosphatidyltransferase [Oscillospiraceae bacterium]|nr:CDP-diacylglycerol--glycerol-3-phosphate 3-phosphatidyltransferase [Oscillospiraceae bacterium]